MHVITGLRTGGAENQLLLLGRHTRTTPFVVALTNADEIATALRAEGIEVCDLGMRSNRELLAVFRLARLMRRVQPDVVHLHLYRATVYGRLAAALARVPAVVTTEHSLLEGVIEGRPTTFSVRALYRATEHWNDETIAVSADVARRLERWGVAGRKIRVIPNAVDTSGLRESSAEGGRVRSELGLPRQAQVVGGVGRLSRVKRWDVLIHALANELGPDFQLLLVGSGEEEPSLRRLARELGVSDWVHLPGSRSDLGAVLAAMDVVVSPSRQETFGLSMVEAAVVGCPVVYVSCPALDAIAPLDGVTRVAGEEADLRAAVLSALNQPTRPACSSLLAAYDVRRVVRQVDDVYVSLPLSRRFRRKARTGTDL